MVIIHLPWQRDNNAIKRIYILFRVNEIQKNTGLHSCVFLFIKNIKQKDIKIKKLKNYRVKKEKRLKNEI